MRLLRTTLSTVIPVAIYVAIDPAHCTSSPPVAEKGPVVAAKPTPAPSYQNKVNRLGEGRIAVTDNLGKPAIYVDLDHGWKRKPLGNAALKIVWTETTQWEWNYILPEFPGGKEAFGKKYPSKLLFLEKTAKAKTIMDVSIPGTPYAFYLINGHPSPYFYDSEKDVIWELESVLLARQFKGMRSISVSSKVIEFSAGGGDMRAYLVVDFSHPRELPEVKYYEEVHLP